MAEDYLKIDVNIITEAATEKKVSSLRTTSKHVAKEKNDKKHKEGTSPKLQVECNLKSYHVLKYIRELLEFSPNQNNSYLTSLAEHKYSWSYTSISTNYMQNTLLHY
jgi:hypothetical protein